MPEELMTATADGEQLDSQVTEQVETGDTGQVTEQQTETQAPPEKTFTQAFMPYKKVGAVKNASLDAALGLEVENGADLHPLAEEIRREEWAGAVEVDGQRLTVAVRNLPAAQRELPGRVLAAGLVLTRYEQVKPTLEDVFLRIVENGKEAVQP